MTPLFIPLKSAYFDAFAAGIKTVEYRVYGPRWNERTCDLGRPVTLSRGYGKHQRLQGVVSGFWKSSLVPLGWVECYGEPKGRLVAYIQIRLDAHTSEGSKP